MSTWDRWMSCSTCPPKRYDPCHGAGWLKLGDDLAALPDIVITGESAKF